MYKRCKGGYALAAVIAAGSILLLLAVSLLVYSLNQHNSITILVNGEAAHFIAEAAVSRCIVSVREALVNAFNSGENSKLYELLTGPDFDDCDITDLLENTWQEDLNSFFNKDEKNASAEIKVYLRNFSRTESDKNIWFEPAAKKGYVVIEAEGRYKNGRRIITVSRQASVFSVLPGPMGKFTLFIKDGGKADKYNLIRNDYKGNVTDGAQPLIIYNHGVPESPQPQKKISLTDAETWKKRGWIWIGGSKTRLNLCSGAGSYGEIFHFYDVSRPNDFSPVSFRTHSEELPTWFKKGRRIPWDRSAETVRTEFYTFGHGFVLDGFHDRSSRKRSDAMYEGGILSEQEQRTYGAKSSVLHLFGDARPGYHSGTKIFGNVNAAFIRFANIEVNPQSSDIAQIFHTSQPKPLYLLRSLTSGDYNGGVSIKEVLGRKLGGPLLKADILFDNYTQYSKYMSRIVEQPYVESYNSLIDVDSKNKDRYFPSKNKILSLDKKGNIQLEGPGGRCYKGIPSGENTLKLLNSRVVAEVDTIDQFWSSYMNDKGELELNAAVRIKNKLGKALKLPPEGFPSPLNIKGGGIIILEKGSLELGGVKCSTSKEALTVGLNSSYPVRFTSIDQNQINVVAPYSDLGYSSRINMFGTLCVGSLSADTRFQGGKLFFREGTDPTLCSAHAYFKIYLSSEDTYWND